MMKSLARGGIPGMPGPGGGAGKRVASRRRSRSRSRAIRRSGPPGARVRGEGVRGAPGTRRARHDWTPAPLTPLNCLPGSRSSWASEPAPCLSARPDRESPSATAFSARPELDADREGGQRPQARRRGLCSSTFRTTGAHRGPAFSFEGMPRNSPTPSARRPRERWTLVGHSLGSKTAMVAALQHAELIERLHRRHRSQVLRRPASLPRLHRGHATDALVAVGLSRRRGRDGMRVVEPDPRCARVPPAESPPRGRPLALAGERRALCRRCRPGQRLGHRRLADCSGRRLRGMPGPVVWLRGGVDASPTPTSRRCGPTFLGSGR